MTETFDFADVFAEGLDAFLMCGFEGPPAVVGCHPGITRLVRMEDLEILVTGGQDGGNSTGAYGGKAVDGEFVKYPLDSADPGRRSITVAQRALGEGYTIVANRVDQLLPAVSTFAASAEAHLQHRAIVNLYLTPSETTGFTAHYDDHDVFLAQVSGSKRWRIWEPEYPLPIHSERTPRQPVDPQGPPDLDLVLEAGQLLYLPRGWIHEGCADGADASIHLTLGIQPTTWAEVLSHHVAVMADHCDALRRAVPFHAHGPDSPELAATLTAFLDQLHLSTSQRNAGDTLRDLCRHRLEHRNAVLDPGSLMAFIGGDDPTATTWLRRRPGLAPVVTVDGDEATITFAGGHVTGPAAAVTALNFVAESDRFRPQDIPGLPSDAQLALARQLVFDGLVRPVDAPSLS